MNRGGLAWPGKAKVVHHCGLVGLIGTPKQVRAQMGALGVVPVDRDEAKYLNHRAGCAPDAPLHVICMGRRGDVAPAALTEPARGSTAA